MTEGFQEEVSKLSLRGWISVLLGKAAQTGSLAHAKAKG